MTRRRVMFVDDEPAILGGLQDLLYRDRKNWDLVFALGAERALEELRARPVDVIVSDMRMPGIDGATLLGIVAAEFPGTARIVLSGHADREAIVRALPSTHQFLSKPCDANVLRQAVARCVDIVHRPPADIRALVGKLERLPSPPEVYFALTRLAQDPDSSLADIDRLIAGDRALAAKVLQLASSAAFGTSRPMSSISRAVSYLGLELIRCLALSSCVLSEAPHASASGFPIEEMHALALRCATFARAIAPPGVEPETAFAAGMLHDIGESVLAIGMPGSYGALRRDARASGEPVVTAERRELGATHAEVGAYLLSMWGLSRGLVDIVRYHHEPRNAPADLQPLVAVIHSADALVGLSGEYALDRELLTSLGLADRVPAWHAAAEQL